MFSYRMGRLTRPRFVVSSDGDSISVSPDAHSYTLYANYALRSILIFVLNAVTHEERVARQERGRESGINMTKTTKLLSFRAFVRI